MNRFKYSALSINPQKFKKGLCYLSLESLCRNFDKKQFPETFSNTGIIVKYNPLIKSYLVEAIGVLPDLIGWFKQEEIDQYND